jgi:hypothetical protein
VPEQFGEEPGARGELLEVVEDDQRSALTQSTREHLDKRQVGLTGDTDCLGDHRCD